MSRPSSQYAAREPLVALTWLPGPSASPRPPPRCALVRLEPAARSCAEVHEDVARLGWPEGGWCW